MAEPRQLKVIRARDTSLGRATIMDRALAQRYGANYVHLAAFAIDIDRVRERDAPELPFAWEVYLTEAKLRSLVDAATKDPIPMLEEMCLAIVELPRPAGGETGPLGAQLPFAVYTAVARGFLPASLGQCFVSWKKPPRALIADMEGMDQRPGLVAQLAAHCLNAPLDPPLVAPVREALRGLAQQAG